MIFSCGRKSPVRVFGVSGLTAISAINRSRACCLGLPGDEGGGEGGVGLELWWDLVAV